MNEGKDRVISLVGTIFFHLAIILCLFFYYIKPSVTDRFSDNLEGVPVMFGNVPDAFGDDEPFGRGDGSPINDEFATPNIEENSLPAEDADEVISESETVAATQDLEETVAVKSDAEKKLETEKKAKAEAERKRVETEVAEKRRVAVEAERKAKAEAEQKSKINSQMSGLFGNGSGSGSRGNTEGTGTQGVPTGNASFGKTSGVGGWGSYDLGGRSVGKGGLVQPSYSVDDYGTVVIDIIVNPQGDVVEATIGRGTNTPSTALKNESLKAARKTKFNHVNTSGNQKGTISYKFNLN